MIIGWMMSTVGLLVVIISLLGTFVNYSEWGVHFCSVPEPYPICGYLLWIVVGFASLGLMGAASVAGGLYLLTRSGKPSS